MKITNVEVFPLEIPFQRPYKIASAFYTHQPIVVIKVHTDEGVWGLGEACPAYEFTGETAHTVETILRERIIPAILKEDPFNVEMIMNNMDKAVVANSSAKAAVDIAVHEIMGKVTKQPVYKLIGGLCKNKVYVTAEIGMANVSESVERCKREAKIGVSTFKIKVGESREKDLTLVKTIRKALGPDAKIWLDANQGWRRASIAIPIIKELEKYDLELVEQPILHWDFKGLSEIRKKVNVPIMLDESVHSAVDAIKAIEEDACDIISIKLMKSGGIHNAVKINAIAEASGIACHMGTMLESSIGVSANLHTTVALRNIQYSEIDIPTTEWGLVEDTSVGLAKFSEKGCCYVKVPRKPGLGVSLKEETLREYNIYSRQC